MMDKNILAALQTVYEQRRTANRAEEQRRLFEAEERIPQLSEVLQQRRQLIYGSIHGMLNGGNGENDLPKQMELLNRRVTGLLTENGFAADWLDPVYTCAKCRDTGYFGEPVREMCPCMRSAYYEQLYARVGLSNQAEESFERFDLNIFPDEVMSGYTFSQRNLMRQLRTVCEKWANDYPYADSRDLFLTGGSGLGKTYLMHAIAKRLLDRGFQVMLVSAYQFTDIARKAYFGKAEGADAQLQSLMEAEILMLDDLGTEPLWENITIVQLFNLFNERQLSGRSTIVSTNLNEKEFRARYTERIASRMLDVNRCKKLLFLGQDVRRRQQQ